MFYCYNNMNMYLHIFIVLVFSFHTTIGGKVINKCLSSSCGCDRIELFPGDTLNLQTGGTHDSAGSWCDQLIVVRQTMQNYDICEGCTLKVEFLETPYSDNFEVTLFEANYTTSSFYYSERLSLDRFAMYDGRSFPKSVDTTGTVLKMTYSDSEYPAPARNLQIRVSPNIPKSISNVAVVVAAVVPTLVFVVILYVILYKVRQRRIAALRTALQRRVNAVIVDAAIDAVILRQARAQQQLRREAPASPDPMDSQAPPSYTEAAPPPPNYDDVVGPAGSRPAGPNEIELEESAGPDRGRDVDLLVV